jgi:hypothetical protein
MLTTPGPARPGSQTTVLAQALSRHIASLPTYDQLATALYADMGQALLAARHLAAGDT